MAIVTTIGGVQINVNPNNIVLLADDRQTGDADLIGATPAMLQLNETSSSLMSRLGISNDFARLTRPDGSAVWINGKSASSVRAPLPGEYAPSTQAVVFAAAITQAVREDLPATIAALNAHGGNL